MQDGLVRANKNRVRLRYVGDTAAPAHVRSYAIECQLNRMPGLTQVVS